MAKVKSYLIKQLKDIMSDDSINWEQKHHKIFYDGLKCAILESLGSSNDYEGVNSSNKTECEHFYEWAMNTH